MNIEPVTLAGRVVTLRPLELEHAPLLAEVGLDPELWRWIPSAVTTPAEMADYVKTALEEQARGSSLPFVTTLTETGAVIGSTRFGNIDRANKRLEIGWTWYTPSMQRTGANTEAKLLLLTHAFETLGANRVELKTDALNTKSRNAIARIGAQQEGIFRRHMVTTGGRLRDTVYFSIIREEWPEVQLRLRQKAER